MKNSPDSQTSAQASLNTVEKVLLLQDLEIFRFVSTEHLAQVAAMARQKEVPAGSTLFKRNDPASDLTLLVRGRVRLESPSGEPREVERQALDFLPMVCEQSRSETATALESCTLLCLPHDELQEFLAGDAEFCWAVLRHVATLASNHA